MSEPDTLDDAQPASPSAANPAWGRGLFVAGVAGVAGLQVYFLSSAEVRDPLHLPIGLAILFLATLPGLLWAKRGRASLPVFEILMLTTANAYALPLLNGHQELIFYIPEDVTAAGWAVLAYQVAAIAVYELTSGRPSTHPFWRDDVITGDMGKWLTYGMALNTAFVIASTFFDVIPHQIFSVLRAVFFGIGIICTFICSRRLGQGELSAGERTFFFANVLLQCVGMISTLFVVGAVSLLLLAFVGYVSSSGRVPVVMCGCTLLLVATLHHGKAEMRALYWQDERRTPALSELPDFFTQWLRFGTDFSTDDETSGKATSKLIERTSLFHIMCLVVSVTPAQQPFMSGETYKDIPYQFVPRLLWPDKPLGHVSTSKLSVYYGLQTEEDTEKTTIGFGMVTEAYANFGFYGVIVVGALLGFVIKKLKKWSEDSPLFSYGGLVVVLFLAWSFQTEFTLSIWLASLYQACLAVLLVPFTLRRIFG